MNKNFYMLQQEMTNDLLDLIVVCFCRITFRRILLPPSSGRHNPETWTILVSWTAFVHYTNRLSYPGWRQKFF